MVVILAILEPIALCTCKIASFARKGIVQSITRPTDCRVSQGTVSPLVHIRTEFPSSQAKCSVPCGNQLSPNAWLSIPHFGVDKEQDSHKEIYLISGNVSIRKKRNRVPDISPLEYPRMPLQKVLSIYYIFW
jgi:hypothetical protein